MVHAAEARGSSLNALIAETLEGAFLQNQKSPTIRRGG